MLKRHEVKILLKADHRKTEVARLNGISLRTVKRIAEEESVVHVYDEAQRGERPRGPTMRVPLLPKKDSGLLAFQSMRLLFGTSPSSLDLRQCGVMTRLGFRRVASESSAFSSARFASR
jgi:hypothetical protein